jgi:site-specific recombinase XerD
MTTRLPDCSTIRLQDHLDRFVTYLVAERDASPYTVKNYSHEIGEFIEFAKEQGVTQLEQIDRNVLRLYLTWLAAEKKARGSIARRLSELRSFGKFLMRQGVLKANVFDTVSAPKLGCPNTWSMTKQRRSSPRQTRARRPACATAPFSK